MSFALKSTESGKLRAMAVQLGSKTSWYEQLQFEEIEVYRYDDLLYEMLELMRATGFIYDFDWLAYGKQAEELVANPEGMTKADYETLRKLFTTHSKNEALENGHLARMIDAGHLQLAVKRLIDLL